MTAPSNFTCPERTGTRPEITPVVSVDHYQVGNGEIGPITSALENVFDDTYFVNGTTGAGLELGAPRSVSLRVGYRF